MPVEAKEKMHSLRRVAGQLGVSYYTALRLAEDGRIRGVRIGRVWRVRESEIRRLIEHGTDPVDRAPRHTARVETEHVEVAQ